MSYTVDQIIERFKKTRHLKLKARTQKDYLRHYGQISSFFGQKLANDLTAPELQEWMRVDSGPIQRNRQLSVLRSLLGAAVDWKWTDYNAARAVKSNPSRKRSRIVADKEIEQFRPYAGKRMPLAVDLTLLTGIPQGGIVQLTWGQVDLKDKVIRYHRKGQALEAPVTPEVQAVLDKCRQLRTKKISNYVFPTRTGDPYTSEGFRAVWQRAMKRFKKAGHNTFRFQDITATWRFREKQKPLRRDEGALETIFEDYPYFDEAVRKEATEMAPYYEVFYCLEQSIRKLVSERLCKAVGADWWESDKINPDIRNTVRNLMARELDMAVRQRSPNEIDYTTFGQLKDIIIENWSLFEDVFTIKSAVARVMNALNLQRGPIAHCTRMDEGEVERLKVLVRDWFETLRKRPGTSASP